MEICAALALVAVLDQSRPKVQPPIAQWPHREVSIRSQSKSGDKLGPVPVLSFGTGASYEFTLDVAATPTTPGLHKVIVYRRVDSAACQEEEGYKDADCWEASPTMTPGRPQITVDPEGREIVVAAWSDEGAGLDGTLVKTGYSVDREGETLRMKIGDFALTIRPK